MKPKATEIDNGKMRTIEEIEEICTSENFTVEDWSRISLEPLKRYLKTL